jgi:hypothetical protein
MRSLSVIGAMLPVVALLAACSSTSASSSDAAAPSPAASQPCTLTVKTWTRGHGGTAFHKALSASSAMRSALKSGSQVNASAEALKFNSAASNAYGYPPPACADPGRYRLGMGDWMRGARDVMDGYLKSASSRIAEGAREIDAVALLNRLSPTVLKRLSQQVVITSAAPAIAPADTSAPPAPAPSAPAPSASAAPAGCYPLSDEGTCYEPGEYCRDDDHGESGIAGDGEAITCEDNDGWRWEPS